MIEIVGQYNTAICYTGELENAAAEQIQAVCDQPAFSDCKIRIMPDVHAGMGCIIGTTMTITDKIVPGMVGVDIGCCRDIRVTKEPRYFDQRFIVAEKDACECMSEIMEPQFPESEILYCIVEVICYV